MQTESRAEEIKHLQRCINDLVVVLALPAIWINHEPSQIANTLVDVLVRMLRLDFAYVRLSDSVEGSPTEWARSTGRRATQPHEIGRALDPWLTAETADTSPIVPNPAGDGVVAIALYRLGLQDEVGRFIAGCQREGFPTAIEQLLMQVAVNQAAVGLQEARHSRQQRRATEELERRVGERTSELAAVNQELRREILERRQAEELNLALAGRLIVSQETERTRIARDLHDGVCQDLASVAVDLYYLRQKGRDIASRDAQEMLQSAQRRTSGVGKALRLLSHGLHPSALQHIGLVAAVQAHCAEVERQHHLEVSFFADAGVEPASRLVALSLFRIAQEALRNTLRHGHARRAAVSLVRVDMDLALRVTDDGQGFDLAVARQKGGLGLVSIEERARLVQGQVTIQSQVGHGTTIDVRVPLDLLDHVLEGDAGRTASGHALPEDGTPNDV